MNVGSGLGERVKVNNLTRKNLKDKSITTIINLILSDQPLSYFKFNDKKFHKIKIKDKGYSTQNKSKNSNFQNNKLSFIEKEVKPVTNKTQYSGDKNNIINHYKIIKYSNRFQYNKSNSFYILPNNSLKYNKSQKCNNYIPNANNNRISQQKKKRNIIKKMKSNSNKKHQKSNSFSLSQNLNYSHCLENKSMKKKNCSANKSHSKNKRSFKYIGKNKKTNIFYLIKKRNNLSHDVKTKINMYIEQQKKYSQRENLNEGNYNKYSYKNLSSFHNNKKLNRNNTCINIKTNTTNISDKAGISTKKNNITTSYINTNTSNYNYNNHNFTTNFDKSTNITETNNEMNNEFRLIKEKRKIKLPTFINSNKSEINIPFNKNSKLNQNGRESSIHNFKKFNLKNRKMGKYNINLNNTSREKKSRLIGLCNNKSFINSFNLLNFKNNISINSNTINNETVCEGIEMNHFRIVSIIQENKKLLKNKE